MGKCDNCGKKILYNKYKRYRKQILCKECYDTRLERKKAKKAALKAQAEALKIDTSSKEEEKKGVSLYPLTAEDSQIENKAEDLDDKDDTAKTSEDTR